MKIIPIKTGTIYCNKSVLTYGKGFNEYIEIPSIAWFIDFNGRKILVDTGMCDTERAHRYHYRNSRQKRKERIDKALNNQGIHIDDIEIVILTHLHWDHCANLDFFKNSEIYVQEKELEYARSPLPPYYNSYESTKIGLSPSYSEVQFRLVRGDKEIIPGVRVILTPGHSIGHQSVLLHENYTRYIIAGDACMCYENLLPNKEKNIEFTMIGRYMDVNSAWMSLKKIKSLSGIILPGHDDTVFKNNVYT